MELYVIIMLFHATVVVCSEGEITAHSQNFPNVFAAPLFLCTRKTLNRTVLDSGRHCPTRASVSSALSQIRTSRLTDSDHITKFNTESG